MMEADRTKDYEQNDATGFIRLNGLRLRVNSTVNGAKNFERGMWTLNSVAGCRRKPLEGSVR